MKNREGHAEAAPAAHGGQRMRAAFLLVIAVCTYLHVPLVSGGRLLVPSLPTVALAPILLLTVRRDVTLADVLFLLKVAFIFLLSIALSPGYDHMQEKFLSMVQFLMALGVAVLIVRLMQQMSATMLERALLVLWCLILAGSILEVFDVIRGASDAFREWAYRELYGLYDADVRDVNMVGWLRPKLFSQEPSHVTKFFIASVNAWLLVRVTWRKALVVAGATVAMLVIMGSPMLLVSAAITLAIVAFNPRQHLRSRVATVAVVMLVGACVGAFFASSTFSTAVTRVESVASSSETEQGNEANADERRILVPYQVLADTLVRYPIFGAGVGGKEVIADERNMAMNSSTLVIGNNALAAFGIFLGLIGGALFFYLLFQEMRHTGVRRLMLMAAMLLLFSQLMGGIDTFRYWGFIALLWGALAVGDSALDRYDQPNGDARRPSPS